DGAHVEAPVEVRAGGRAGSADVADYRAAADAVAVMHGQGALMHVDRRHARAMVEDGAVAEQVEAARAAHDAVVGGNDGPALGSADVDPLVAVVDRAVADPADTEGGAVVAARRNRELLPPERRRQ